MEPKAGGKGSAITQGNRKGFPQGTYRSAAQGNEPKSYAIEEPKAGVLSEVEPSMWALPNLKGCIPRG